MNTACPKRTVVLASHNPGKLKELGELLGSLGLEVLSIADFTSSPVPEDAPSFVENALVKARAACNATQMPAIADDSGLEVDALDGRPGVHSARYAGLHADDSANNSKLLKALADCGNDNRTARFRSVVVFLRHAMDPAPIIAEGVWVGSMLTQPLGSGGFGYDPLFFDPVSGLSAAQLTAEEKNRRSHRGMAMRKLCARLRAEWIERGG